MILLDTSVIVAAFSPPYMAEPALRQTITAGHKMVLTTLVLYEWRRGPRQDGEVEALELLFPTAQVLGFGALEAVRAAALCRQVKNPRRREFDIALAACAIEWECLLWTLNPADFRDIPGMRLYVPPS